MTTKPRVLIVDDEPDVAEIYRDVVSTELGLECDVAYTHEDAIALSIRNYIAVICDICGVDGLGVLQYYKLESPNTKRVLMSGYDSPPIPRDLDALFFTKPRVTSEIRNELARVLGCSRNNCSAISQGPCLPSLEVREMRQEQERISTEQKHDREHVEAIAGHVSKLDSQHDTVIEKLGEATGEIKAFRSFAQIMAIVGGIVGAIYGTLITVLLYVKG